jgi:Mg2+ and Co2+ transporter CorA
VLQLSLIFIDSLGIILLDPPFEPLDTLGSKVLASSYRSFQCRPLFSDQDNGGLDKRGSYVDSVVEYLEHLNIRDHSDFHPLVVIKGVTYIVASEWITTNAYIERDLNTIEWMLESTKLDLEVFEKLLSKLFTHRRRIGKYASLVDNQAELFETGLPALWDNTTGSHLAKEALRDIRSNATQVRCVVKRNADRVGRSVDFLVSMMSVREGEQSVKQNHMLMFLTLVATFALPFNAVAAILGIQTKYGPENEGFWVFWAGSSAAWVCIAAVYMVMSLVKRFKRQREV